MMLFRIFRKLLERGVDPAVAEQMAEELDREIRLSDDRMGQARDALAQRTPPAEPLVTYELTDEQMERMLDLYMQNQEVVLSDDRMGQAEAAFAQRTTPEERETLEILLSTGMDPERAQDLAQTINDTRRREGTTREGEIAANQEYNEKYLRGEAILAEWRDRFYDSLRPLDPPSVQDTPGNREPATIPTTAPVSSEERVPVQDTPGNREPQVVRKPGEELVSSQVTSSDPEITPVKPAPRTTYATPANEDPGQYADLFVQLFDRLGSDTTFDAKGDTSELNAWATRLEDTEMRMLFAPREYVNRADAKRSDEWNNLVEEALDSTNARRQRVGANIFILELLESLEGADENFVGDSKFDGSGVNHADHIFAFNELVFGEQIDMMALARGETISVGDIELSDGYIIPDVQLSSLQDYVDLNDRLYENVEPKSIWEIFSRPREAYEDGVSPGERIKIEYEHLDRVFNDWFGVRDPLGRDVFEKPLDWLLLYDDRIASSEAARDEYQILDTTINQLGSPRGEDVGGGLIRAGYTDELQALEVPVEEDGSIYVPDRTLIESAQEQIGSVQPPGQFQPYTPEELAYLDQYNIEAIRAGVGDEPFVETGIDGVGDIDDVGGIGGVGDGEFDWDALDPDDYQILKDYISQNYGGFSFFLELEDETLNIGLNEYDKPVPRNSPEAVRNVHLLKYIVGDYVTHDMTGRAGQITDDQLLFEAVRATEWYETTNVSMREWQGGGGVGNKYALVGGADPMARFQELNIYERQQIVGVNEEGSIYEDLVTAAKQLMGPGAEDTIGQERLMQLAAQIDYLGYDTDNVELRKRLLDTVVNSEQQFQSGTADFSSFRFNRDWVDTRARDFYLPITEERRNSYAEKLFTGEMTEADIIAQIRTQAISRYGTSDQVRAALQAGLTMSDYFDPYIAEMETILDRPVDLMMEFPEIIEMVSADGVARPMTHAELGEYVRGLPEWGQSDQGQDTARGLVQSIGALFGETA